MLNLLVTDTNSGDIMKIGILGCDAIRKEIEMVTANDPDVVYREYLEFGLHLHPDDLKSAILKKLDSIPVGVDALFLGYGHCQALKDIPKSIRVPTVMLEYEDCIAAMITPERYHHEKHNGGITWFYPAGWAVNGLALFAFSTWIVRSMKGMLQSIS